MPDISKDLIILLNYLLPGFLVAWIYFSLTSHQRPSQFERVVQALIFALFVHFLVTGCARPLLLLSGRYRSFGTWDQEAEAFTSLFIALGLGVLFSYLNNSDRLHSRLRAWGFTTRSSHPSEWCTAFETKKTWIALELKDGRRLYGWPYIWPADPTKGHIFITHGMWLEEPEEEKQMLLSGVEEFGSEGAAETETPENPESDPPVQILVDVTEVKWVEFIDS